MYKIFIELINDLMVLNPFTKVDFEPWYICSHPSERYCSSLCLDTIDGELQCVAQKDLCVWHHLRVDRPIVQLLRRKPNNRGFSNKKTAADQQKRTASSLSTPIGGLSLAFSSSSFSRLAIVA